MSATDHASWDGATYHQVSAPQTAWGQRVLSRLVLAGDERVLDAGCGTGKLTAALLDRLPRGHVIAFDNSASMLTEARRALSASLDRVTLTQGDLLDLSLAEEDRVDVVFSTATFHWILDHAALFARLFAALVPGGRLLAQCGGAGNLATLYANAAAARQHPDRAPWFVGFEEPLCFAGPAETAGRLEAAGFISVDTSLEDAPTAFEDAAAFRTFIASVCLRHDLEALPAPLRDGFLDEITERAARHPRPFVLDYVRLNIAARRR